MNPTYLWASPLEQLGRGLTNVVTSPVEIPKQVRRYWIRGSEKTFHIIAWVFCGAVKGMINSTARLGSGFWDVVTVVVPRSTTAAPLMKPDYVFEEWPKRVPGVVYKNINDQ